MKEAPKNERVMATSVRLSEDELARVDAAVVRKATLTRTRVTRQDMLRAFVQDGLREVERKR